MKVFTKLFLTFALLCFAGVVNAATEYEVDQKFTSIAELNGTLFAVVDETPATPTAMGIGIPNHGNGWDMYFGTITEAYNSNACFYKLEAAQGEGLDGYYYLRTFKNDGTMYTAWGDANTYGYFNSQTGAGGYFALGLNGQNGQDALNHAVWAIEVSEGKFALKNIGTGKYLHADQLSNTYDDAFYFTFCTLKAGGETPDPVIEEPEAPLAEGELIPDFFSICNEGAIPYGYAVKFGTEDRAYPNTYTGGARMFNFAEGGDFTKAIYFREGYVQYGDVKKLALEAGKKYIVHFNSAMWKASGADMTFLIYKEGDLENAVLTQTIANTPDVNGSKDAVTGSTASEIEFTPDADGNYILKWDASGWKEVLLANPGVKVAAATPAEMVAFDWVAAEQGYTNQQDLNDVAIALDAKTTMTCSKGTGSTTPKYYTSGGAVRTYGGNTITFAGEGITKIVITGVSGKVAELTANTGELTTEGIVTTWKGEANEIVLTNNTSNQQHIAKLHVVYGGVEADAEPVHIANTIDEPYTVAKAVELIDAGDALDETVFVKGIISKIETVNEEQEFITYWISDNGSTEGQQFECYKGKTMEGLALADIEVGAEVIATGKLTKYNDIYEFAAGNTIAAYVAPAKPLFADGTYYIKNVASGNFLTGANSWGTQASVAPSGAPFEITFLTEGGYSLKYILSTVTNKFLGSNLYVDSTTPAGGFAIEKNEDGTFAIKLGDKYLAEGTEKGSTNDAILVQAETLTDAAKWQILTLDEAVAALKASTNAGATFLISNPNFNRNTSTAAWTVSADCTNKNLSGGADGNRCAESYHSTFTISQVLANAPAGKYKMTAQGFYRQDDGAEEAAPVFFANDKEAQVPVKTGTENSMNDASASFTAGSYTIEPFEFTVFEDGQLTIGVKNNGNTHQWVIWDNFQITYLTSEIPAEEFKPAYEAALAAAQAALANEDYAAVTGEEKTALEKAIADYSEIAEPTTELYKAAISALNAATSAFTTAKGAYETFNNTAASMADVLFPYAAPAKKAAAEASTAAAPKSAAEATALTEAVLKAYRQYAESSALLECQYGAAVNMTESIVNPNAEEAIAEPWAVVLGEGSGGSLNILDGEPLTDGDGNSAYKYFDGGNWGANAWDVALEQTITLPAGKYYLTVAGRASADVDLNLFAGETTAKIAAVGASGGLFGRGWGDASVEFEMAEAGEIKIGVRGVTSVVHNWMSFTRFRLMQFGVAGEDIAEPTVPEGKVNLISNGNLAGANVESFVAKEYPSADIIGARIVDMAGKDNSHGLVVKSADEVGKEGAQDWDTQFWINFNQALPEGAKLHVEFDYAANKAAKAGTQAHGAPGAYQHWAAIGDVNFTTEWQHFSTDIDVNAAMAKGDNGNGSGIGMQSIAFNLAVERTAVEYYFDNFGIWAEIPAPVEDWTDIVVNGDMEGADMVNFFATEQGVGGPFVATATEGIGKNGSKAVKVQSADSPANDWATQFFIRLPYQLPAGTKYKVSFDYKADKAGDFDTQAHAEPGQYIHWAMIGSGSFTSDWQTYTAEGSVPAECDGSQGDGFLKIFQSIAFNLAKNKVATEFIFDNVKFEVPTAIVETLVKNPYIGKDADELQAPDGWTKAIANGNLAGDDVTSFVSKEYPSTEIVGARIVAGAGKDYSRGIVVKAGDDTANSAAQAWDSQFWIQLNDKLPEGSKIHIEFDYKASKAAKASTQAHSAPGDYLHWAMMGDVNFTTEWQHFSADVDVTAAMAKGDNGNGSGDGLFSIAFNLQEEKSAVDYYFDNFGVWYQIPVVDGINAMKNEMNAKSVYNLNGQKVNVTKKGLYIMNGKKVVIK